VLIERVLDLAILIGLLLLGLLLLPSGVVETWVVKSAAVVAVLIGIGLVLPCLFPWLLHGLCRRVADSLLFTETKLGLRLRPMMVQAVELMALLGSRRLMAALLGHSLAAWMLEGATFACVGLALSGGIPLHGYWTALA